MKIFCEHSLLTIYEKALSYIFDREDILSYTSVFNFIENCSNFSQNKDRYRTETIKIFIPLNSI